MTRHQPILRRACLGRAAVAGLRPTMLLSKAKPIRAANAGQEQVSRDFHQAVTLGAGQSVRVEHKFGSISVHGESGREVKISATIRAQAGSHEEAESFAEKIKIQGHQTRQEVPIQTISPAQT